MPQRTSNGRSGDEPKNEQYDQVPEQFRCGTGWLNQQIDNREDDDATNARHDAPGE
jgi:hypothetical protein